MCIAALLYFILLLYNLSIPTRAKTFYFYSAMIETLELEGRLKKSGKIRADLQARQVTI
jgi:hypothetical protein